MTWFKNLKLSKRERIYLYGGVAFVIFFLFFQFLLSPFLDAREKTLRSIEAKKAELKEISLLGAEYEALKKSTKGIGGVIAARSGDFTLFSFLEKQAGRAGVKANIEYMKPSTSNDKGPYRISSIEMKLEKITLKQLVEYLQLAESRKYLVKVKRMSIKKSKANPQYLTALIHFITNI